MNSPKRSSHKGENINSPKRSSHKGENINSPKRSSLWLATRQTLRVFNAHYRQAPLQAGAILIGIILAVTLLTGVRATNESAIDSYSEAAELLSHQASSLIMPRTGQALDESLYFTLRQRGFSHSLAVLEGRALDQHQQAWQIEGSDLVAALAAVSTAPTQESSTQESSNQESSTQERRTTCAIDTGRAPPWRPVGRRAFGLNESKPG
ncbi:hypothetical protein [Shewanella sp.]|uniref:hypothetical protein n=1 Tax=Shewanella sp. TaxID=50422 RepID=UPI003D09A751